MSSKCDFPVVKAQIKDDYYYEQQEILMWVTHCMIDAPIKMGISKYPEPIKTANELMDIVIAWKEWYHRWFDQLTEE